MLAALRCAPAVYSPAALSNNTRNTAVFSILARWSSSKSYNAPKRVVPYSKPKNQTSASKKATPAAKLASNSEKKPSFKKHVFQPRGVVALVGRPNVGKSTLFNRLVGRQLAIVDPTPGTTRDRKIGEGNIAGLEFTLLDTPGLDESPVHETNESKQLQMTAFVAFIPLIDAAFQTSMTAQTLAAVREADVILFLVDVRAGITPVDQRFASWLRRELGKANSKASVITVANKGEGQKFSSDDALEFASLGFVNIENPLLISAEHNDGMDDLFQVLNRTLPELPTSAPSSSSTAATTSLPLSLPESSSPSSLPSPVTSSSSTDSVAPAEEASDPELKRMVAPAEIANESELSRMVANDPELRRMVDEAERERVDASMTEAPPPIKLAVIGRPNVGKSTLINALTNSDRLVVSPVPHTTRDSVFVDFEYDGRAMKLIDTAGLMGTSSHLRKRLSRLDGLVMDESIRTLRLSNVCSLIVDIEPRVAQSDLLELLRHLREKGNMAAQLNRPDYINRLANLIFVKNDITIASKAIQEGRALVLLINKLDLIPPALHDDVMDGLALIVKHVLPSVRGVPLIPISALHKKNLGSIIPAVMKQFDRWNTVIPTYKLNQWMREVARIYPPPKINGGRPSRIRFIRQTHTRPPHFGIFFSTTPDSLPDSYVRYLTNRMRSDFDLHGVPIRVTVKKSRNPYADASTQQAQAQSKRVL